MPCRAVPAVRLVGQGPLHQEAAAWTNGAKITRVSVALPTPARTVQGALVEANAICPRGGAAPDRLLFRRAQVQRAEQLLTLLVQILEHFIVRDLHRSWAAC